MDLQLWPNGAKVSGMLAVDFTHVSQPLMSVIAELSEAPPVPFTQALRRVAAQILACQDEETTIAAIEEATGDADDWLPNRERTGTLLRRSSLRILGDHYEAAVKVLEQVPTPKPRVNVLAQWQFGEMIYRSNAPASMIRDIAKFLAGMLSILVIEFAATNGRTLNKGQAAGIFRYIPDMVEMLNKYSGT